MRPEDIQNRDFLVGLRGYDKEEVRSFLAEVAAEHAALLADMDQARIAEPAPFVEPVVAAPKGDDFENLGASVAAILRAAKDSASEMSAEASEHRVRAIEEAGDIRREAEADAEEMRSAARNVLDDARAEADRIVREAADRARSIEIETEARINNKEAEAAHREAAARTRLLEASDEVQLALAALDHGGVDLREAALGANEQVSVDSTH